MSKAARSPLIEVGPPGERSTPSAAAYLLKEYPEVARYVKNGRLTVSCELVNAHAFGTLASDSMRRSRSDILIGVDGGEGQSGNQQQREENQVGAGEQSGNTTALDVGHIQSRQQEQAGGTDDRSCQDPNPVRDQNRPAFSR
jgi:hypothetical protein